MSSPQDIEFLRQLEAKIEENIAADQFGVSELADLMNMSRSNLLRKAKKATNLSVSQLISQARLRKAMELLRTTSANVSEVAHQVGFSSTSYFIKCFREHYGYPPGEASKRLQEVPESTIDSAPVSKKSNKLYWLVAAVLVIVALSFVAWYNFLKPAQVSQTEKSIVVLPFKNDSSDSTNVYLINGLMEATLINLQKIKDLRVLSRTSAEKFRNNPKTIPEMAAELNVGYFIEGSGQKIGDRIVLNIQLIDGRHDKHLWSKQYRRQTSDVFTLQQEISKDIAEEIRVVITPEERKRIDKVLTSNKEAWDFFLKGLDHLKKRTETHQQEALAYFQQAIKEDSTFALAYACAGISCYNIDFGRKEKTYLDMLGSYADKALLFDPKLAESLRAKAMYYLLKKDFKQVPIYLEKALEYNPNSEHDIALLADFYSDYHPNTAKYIEYALKGIKLGSASGDSITVSYLYLRLGNALIQSGFVNESLYYLDKSISYYPLNPFSRYVRSFVVYAKDHDLVNTRRLLMEEFRKDNNRLDILKDLGKVNYYLGEFELATENFEKFLAKEDSMGVDLFPHENMIIAVTFDKAGKKDKAKKYKELYRQFLLRDQSSYNDLGWSGYYAYEGDLEQSLKHLKLFADEDNIQYWVILFIDQDPMCKEAMNTPEFKAALDKVKERFWKTHEKIRERLEEERLL